MAFQNRRTEIRGTGALRTNPVGCTLYAGNVAYDLTVINFHHRGACLKLSTHNEELKIEFSRCFLRFKLGVKEIVENIKFRVVWDTISENGLFGVEFLAESAFVLKRSKRFLGLEANVPVVSCQDPIDPNRILYFKAMNISDRGLLLSTSLSNKHLFPGMELRAAQFSIAGFGKAEIDLFVENSRLNENKDQVHYGVSIKGNCQKFTGLISSYLSGLGSVVDDIDRAESLYESELVSKSVRKNLTIREISSSKEYEQVLKLRYQGYKKAGKTKPTDNWTTMGEGLENEGLVLGAFAAGQLIASVEFRLSKASHLKIADRLDLSAFEALNQSNLAEINKLVVHPAMQSTDVVLGLFQKIHSIAILNGSPDGIIFADDVLVSLYQRLGFFLLGYSEPHPTKPKVNLHLMAIKGKAYENADGMNPYAWEVAFSETEKFFALHGIQKKVEFGFTRKIVKLISRLVALYIKHKKAKRIRAKEAPSSENHMRTKLELENESKGKLIHRNFSDPKWTKQHINATVLLPYILEATNKIGSAKVDQILRDFLFDLKYFKSSSNWVSVAFFDEFLLRYSVFGDPYELNRRAGARSTSREILGGNYFLMKHFLNPAMAFKAFEKYLPKFNKTRVYKVIESSATSCRIRIYTPDKSLLPKSHSTKENWVALIEAYIEVMTGKSGKVETIKSSFEGDEYCEYFATWKNPVFKGSSVLVFVASCSGLYALFKEFNGPASFKILATSSAVAVFIWIIFLTLRQFSRIRTKYDELLESMATFESEADERYRELQLSKSILEKGYQEGRILENLNREIQKSHDLQNLLNVSLAAICGNFEVKRAFVMLLDHAKKSLVTSAIYGADEKIGKMLWSFKVDVSVKRDQALVLSSVFHTSQSIMINDIAEHMFHLNEESKALIEALNSKGFLIVPIPSEVGNWGVLVADKGKDASAKLIQRDLVAIQRVCQSVGLAIDKKMQLEKESHARRVFQKFVPVSVVKDTLEVSGGLVGGENREIVCMFVDIRNFTAISESMPPRIVCDLLNSVFTILQKVVSGRGGIIDKFLGDGALVTWGAVPGSIPDCSQAIAAIDEFFELLSNQRQNHIKLGLPLIELGVGIHKGPAISGIIGSEDRMEFTVIGSTVNLAARLEQLTKLFNTGLVISEQVLNELPSLQDWVVEGNVKIRGIDQAIKIGYRPNSILEKQLEKKESA